MKSSWVYIVANPTRTIYTGVTSDLHRRIWQHKTHSLGDFSKRYNCTRLVYFVEFSDILDAIAWEKSLKGKSRAKKMGLIEEQNPRWNDLAWDWYTPEELIVDPDSS